MSGISNNVTIMQTHSNNLTWLKGALSVGIIPYLNARPHKNYGIMECTIQWHYLTLNVIFHNDSSIKIRCWKFLENWWIKIVLSLHFFYLKKRSSELPPFIFHEMNFFTPIFFLSFLAIQLVFYLRQSVRFLLYSIDVRK